MPDLTTPQHGPAQPPPHDPVPRAHLRVLVADDNPVVRAGLTALLSGRADITVVAEAADGREAYDAARRLHPDVILLDVRMPGVDGLSALPHLVRIAPVLMLTYSNEPETVREAMRKGAKGYLVHGEFKVDELVTAVRRSASAYESSPGKPSREAISTENLSRMQPDVGQSSSGWPGGRAATPDNSRYQLSTREAEIMDLIASGLNNQQIAATCFISEKTVKNHINRIFAKLHSTSRAEAAAKWLGTAPGLG
ncbi:response regulator [Streptomyces sp. NPDC090106]|uniref:response regulator transcription factor n=1 Tax=Streptomyces sp. NPDC090106 TaxID=3365946 RepID=UPI00381C2632